MTSMRNFRSEELYEILFTKYLILTLEQSKT